MPKVGLFQSKLDALGFFGFANLAENSLFAALGLGNGFAKTHLRLSQRHVATLENLAIKATNDVFVSFVLIFSCNFNRHIASHYTRDVIKLQYEYIVFGGARIWQKYNWADFGPGDGVGVDIYRGNIAAEYRAVGGRSAKNRAII